jgi:hypothetical protein
MAKRWENAMAQFVSEAVGHVGEKCERRQILA